MKILAAKQNWSREQKVKIAEIEIRATRRMGELLKQTEKAKGTRGQLTGPSRIGGSTKEPPIEAPKLEDLGINKKQSHIAQQLASVPEKD